MLNVVDVASHQGDFHPENAGVDCVIVKATEGLDYVNPFCDRVFQRGREAGMGLGYYHYAKANDPVAEADYFRSQTVGYERLAIPILDWEENQSVTWVNRFVDRYHDLTGVWPMIYANPWRFEQGGVRAECGRWVAAYRSTPPTLYGGYAMWQYTSTGTVGGYGGPVDLSKFYGDLTAWKAYATGGMEVNMATIDDVYNQLMRTDDPTGRGVEMNTHDHVKWIAAKQAEDHATLARIEEALEKLLTHE